MLEGRSQEIVCLNERGGQEIVTARLNASSTEGPEQNCHLAPTRSKLPCAAIALLCSLTAKWRHIFNKFQRSRVACNAALNVSYARGLDFDYTYCRVSTLDQIALDSRPVTQKKWLGLHVKRATRWTSSGTSV